MKQLDDLKSIIRPTLRLYSFHRSIMKIIGSAADLHIQLMYSGIENCNHCQRLAKYIVISPVLFEFKKDILPLVVPNGIIEEFTDYKYNLSYFNINEETIIESYLREYTVPQTNNYKRPADYYKKVN